MTRKLCALVLATLLLCATPLAGAAVAADAGNTTGNTTDETAGNDSTTDDETAGNDSVGNETDSGSLPFGLQVSSFVDDAKENESGPLGPLVASFVVSNNPGNAPDHAGPPAWVVGGNDTDENETDDRGPPEDVGPNGTQGPPDDAGPSENETGGPSADAGPDNDTRGPPADAGPGDDDTADDEEESETDDEDEEADTEDGDDDRRGPPDHAGQS